MFVILASDFGECKLTNDGFTTNFKMAKASWDGERYEVQVIVNVNESCTSWYVWQVTVMRKDYEPLTEESMETIWMYHDYLLELFGEGNMAIPQRQMNRTGFDRFCEGYKDERLINGYMRFQNMHVPL